MLSALTAEGADAVGAEAHLRDQLVALGKEARRNLARRLYDMFAALREVDRSDDLSVRRFARFSVNSWPFVHFAPLFPNVSRALHLSFVAVVGHRGKGGGAAWRSATCGSAAAAGS